MTRPTAVCTRAGEPADDALACANLDAWMSSLNKRLRGKLPCREDAEDLAQEACLKFLVECERRDDIRNPRAYLYRIAQNLLYRHYKDRTRYAIDTEVGIDTLLAKDPSLEDRTNDTLRIEQIFRACRELSPKCLRVLRLRWQEGLSVIEIAECMDLSRAMVKKYLAQGLVHCRKRLGRIIAAERLAA